MAGERDERCGCCEVTFGPGGERGDNDCDCGAALCWLCDLRGHICIACDPIDGCAVIPAKEGE